MAWVVKQPDPWDEYFADADECSDMWCSIRRHAMRFEDRTDAKRIAKEYGGRIVRLVKRESPNASQAREEKTK